jgi:hypothetical protein
MNHAELARCILGPAVLSSTFRGSTLDSSSIQEVN